MKEKITCKSFMAVVCAMALLLGFSSCSGGDEKSIIYSYSAQGNISASSGDAFDSLFAITDYTEAITGTLGNYYFDSEKDNEIISICDKVYQKHRADHPTWNGSVELEKSEIGTSGEILASTVLKVYQYE